MMGDFEVDDVDLDDQTNDQTAAVQPEFTDIDDPYVDIDDPSATKQPGWFNLAWQAVKGAGSQMDPRPLLKQLYDETAGEASKALTAFDEGRPLDAASAALKSNPINAVTRVGSDMALGMAKSQWEQFRKAKQAYQTGSMSEALGHTLAGVMPVIGPAAADVGEEMGAGFEAGDRQKVAHAVGGGAGLIAPLAIGRPVARGVTAAAESINETVPKMLDRYAERKLLKKIAPQVGKDKARFGNIGAEIAPRLLREPGMGGGSVAAVEEKVAGKLQAATDALQAEYDKFPGTKSFPTSPVVRMLQEKLKKLTPTGIGGSVEPANRASRIAALKQAIEEVKGLGSVANIDNLRDLRIAWDEGAKKAFTPSIQQDFLTARGSGHGWADARGVLSDYLGQSAPGTVPLNAEYSFWRSVHDVMSATEESERTRPSVGRQMVGSFAGMEAGAHLGGVGGMMLGYLLGPVVDIGIESGVTTKIASARAMARLADAIRGGNKALQVSALRGIAAATRTSKELDTVLKQIEQQQTQQQGQQKQQE